MRLRMMIVAAGLALAGSAASAGVVENACLKSDRKVSRALCGCIQQVADQTLTGSDQRKAARFFRDPDAAQEMRVSKSAANNDFWKKYKNFGDTAQAYCAVAG